MKKQIKYITIKKAIRKKKNPDNFSLSKYSSSPYMACEHACKYCDGRAERYYVEGDFEKDIVIRKNIAEIFTNELNSLRDKGIISFGSGISDPYQPIETQERLMQKISQKMTKNRFPALVMTKSALIQRDLQDWKIINKKNGFILFMSIAFPDEDLRTIFEPNASSLKERFDTLKLFKENGIRTGVLMMPILPFIGDNVKKMEKLIRILKDIGVDFIIPGNLTLRPGKQKKLYLKIIQINFPKFISAYKRLYSENRSSGNTSYQYRKELYPRIGSLLKKYSIPYTPPHSVYKNILPVYDELLILIKQMLTLYDEKGINTQRLQNSFKEYKTWLKNRKEYFNRNRKLSANFIEEELTALIRNGFISEIITNQKLADFLYKVVIEKKIFDPIKLKLINSEVLNEKSDFSR